MNKQYPYDYVIYIQRIMLGHSTHKVTVIRIGDYYHCRVFTNGILNQEAKCLDKLHIGRTCRDLLRWEAKMGNWSDYSDKSRTRKSMKTTKRNDQNKYNHIL